MAPDEIEKPSGGISFCVSGWEVLPVVVIVCGLLISMRRRSKAVVIIC